jgi:hypothetical protein
MSERELRLRAFVHFPDVHTIGQWRVFEEMFEAVSLNILYLPDRWTARGRDHAQHPY